MLTSHTKAILEALDEDGGFTTGLISERAKIAYASNNRRARSHAIRSWLIGLMKDGYVELLDNQKPDCWKRTTAGTAALSD